ncbi:ABC transporter permease [Cytophagaceae bacterium YF14B1]|uniref:ABC transporter permease n=1 Tax=Xanthocytophaga flava TaxID=3048013 RepID=A0AAE3U5L1_9BACT|nr:ABC transporter permease [Xanthocytophaga flavus]MDJ1479642.1 ABC transporter permease [Xanthocytophaga flavus]
MIRNYIKIAFRNLLKNKAYSSINILGLSVGMAVAILIGLWIYDELSYDKFHTNYDRLAQVYQNQTFSGTTSTSAAIPVPLAGELRTKYAADFKSLALASWNFEHILAFEDKKFTKEGMFTEPELPQMLSLKMIQGTLDGLKDPSSILITKSLAETLFGDTDPINKIIKLDNKTTLKVTGVYEDLPYNSTLHSTSFLIPWEKYLTLQNWVKESQTQWNNNSFQLFVQIADKAEYGKINSKIKNVVQSHRAKGEDDKPVAFLHPMSQWHLYSEFKNGINIGGRIQFVWLFGIIGTFVLLLACINFMNLSTARSEKRAKEVGIRKAIGSVRQQLIGQFLSESLVIAGIAFLVGVFLVLCTLPWFNTLADKEMSILWTNPVFWISCLTFTAFTGLISGSYPAFYLSSFQPVKVLKGTFKAGRLASLPRKVLVVVQFTVSVSLIIGTIIVFRQIQYAKNRPIGYDREGLITVMMNTPELYGHYDVLRSDLIKTGAVENMSESSSPTTGVWSNQIGFDWEGKDPNMLALFGTIAVTHDYGKTVGWQFKEGRDFSREYATDSVGFVFNEAAVKYAGIKDPVGKTVRFNDKKYTIIGIIKDMVMESPFDPIKPTIFLLDYGWANVITIKMKAGINSKNALAKVEAVFKKHNPGSPFDFKFVDKEYEQKFRAEERIGTLASFFASLAIFISCLGLFGLASFMAEQRTKEIGIRKVLGASVVNLWQLLSKDFVTLVIISFLIAVPIAYFTMSQWLEKYEYRSEISWWVFVLSGVGAMVITLLTVSFQAIKAALANPVKSLRSE